MDIKNNSLDTWNCHCIKMRLLKSRVFLERKYIQLIHKYFNTSNLFFLPICLKLLEMLEYILLDCAFVFVS